MGAKGGKCLLSQAEILGVGLSVCSNLQEDEDEEAEVPSETEAGEEDEVDVCAVERIPALCSRYNLFYTYLFLCRFLIQSHIRKIVLL